MFNDVKILKCGIKKLAQSTKKLHLKQKELQLHLYITPVQNLKIYQSNP